MDIWIKIRSLFEDSGVKEATDAQSKLSSAAKASGDATAQGGRNLQQTGQAAGRAAEMVASLTGAMGASSPAAAQMSSGIRVLKSLIEGSSAGFLGLATVIVGVGISAWSAYQKKVEESKKKIAELLDALTSAKIETATKHIDDISDAFGRVEKSISAVRAAQVDLAAAWQDLNKAGQDIADMELNRREKEQLSQLSPTDTAGSVSVKNRFAKLREEVSVSRREGDAIRAEQAAKDDLEAASAHRINIEGTLSTALNARDVLSSQIERSSHRAGYTLDEKERERAKKEVVEFTATLVALNKSLTDLTDSLSAAKTKETAAGITLQAAQLRGSTGIAAATALAAQNASDLDRDTAQARFGQKLGDLRSRASTAASSWSVTASEYRARSNAYDPQRRDYDDQGKFNMAKITDKRLEMSAKGAEKQAAAAEKLLDQLERTPPEKIAALLELITRQLVTLEQGLAATKEHVRNLPSQNN